MSVFVRRQIPKAEEFPIESVELTDVDLVARPGTQGVAISVKGMEVGNVWAADLTEWCTAVLAMLGQPQ